MRYAPEHGVQGVGDGNTCNTTNPTTLPKEAATQALDLAHSPATNVRSAVPTTSRNIRASFIIVDLSFLGVLVLDAQGYLLV